MSAVQQSDKISFGSCRVFVVPTGTTTQYIYGNVNEFDFDQKTDNKSIWDENGFPLAVFDGHKSLDISVKHYTNRLDTTAQDLAQAAPGASTIAYSIDETASIPATPYTVTPAQTPIGPIDVQVVQASGIPVRYVQVTSGTEVAGKSYSVTAGVLKFAAGDTLLPIIMTYQYANTSGSNMLWTNTYQNSAPTYKLYAIKRDRSPIDNSVGQSIITLNAVRFGGLKYSYKDGSETVYERTLAAFADPTGNVGSLAFVNTSTNNAP